MFPILQAVVGVVHVAGAGDRPGDPGFQGLAGKGFPAAAGAGIKAMGFHEIVGAMAAPQPADRVPRQKTLGVQQLAVNTPGGGFEEVGELFHAVIRPNCDYSMA